MPRFDPTGFGHLLACLTPQEQRGVEGMGAEARERAEAVLEIDPPHRGSVYRDGRTYSPSATRSGAARRPIHQDASQTLGRDEAARIAR